MNRKKTLSDTMKIIVSIIFAALLWYYVVTDQNPLITKSYDIPVKLLNMEYIEKNDLILMQNPNNLKVTIKLKGYKDNLDLVSQLSITASADLMGIKSKGEVRTNISFSGIPNGITLVDQSASELILNLDRKISSHLKVSYKYKGKLADGFAPVINNIDPPEILITGPESIVSKAKYALLTVDITGLTGDTIKDQTVTIYDAENKELNDISVQPKTQRVSLSLGVIKLVPILPQFTGKALEGYSVLERGIYPKFVSIAAKKDVLDSIKEIKTEKISIAGISERMEKNVKLILPPGIALVENDIRIRAFADIEKVITKEIKKSIEIRNLGEGLSVEGVNQEITLTVVGPESIVENPAILIKAYADMEGIIEGEHVLKVLWDTPKGFTIQKANPANITINVKKII